MSTTWRHEELGLCVCESVPARPSFVTVGKRLDSLGLSLPTCKIRRSHLPQWIVGKVTGLGHWLDLVAHPSHIPVLLLLGPEAVTVNTSQSPSPSEID